MKIIIINYIGEWLNGQRHGKGKMFPKDANIIYEETFVKDISIWENDEYHTGESFSENISEKENIYKKGCSDCILI